jgi:hypothetical protein
MKHERKADQLMERSNRTLDTRRQIQPSKEKRAKDNN